MQTDKQKFDELYTAVQAMRAAQQQYFDMRRMGLHDMAKKMLVSCKSKESKVDALIDTERTARNNIQAELFK